MIFIKGATHCAGVITAPPDVSTDPPDVSHAEALPEVRDAEHESSISLPLIPSHVQEKEIVPDTADGVPAKHKLVVGADENVPPSDDPKAPSIGVGVLDSPIVTAVPVAFASPAESTT